MTDAKLKIVSGGDPSSLIKKKVSQAITKTMKGMSVPNHNASVGIIPGLGVTTSSYVLKLTGGKISSATATVTSITEPSTDKFALAILLVFEVTYSNWNESYDMTTSASPKPVHVNQNLGAWSFSFTDFTFDVAIDLSSSTIGVAITSLSAKGLTFKIPKRSALNTIFSCVNSKINSAMKSSIQGTNFSALIEGGVKKALSGL